MRRRATRCAAATASGRKGYDERRIGLRQGGSLTNPVNPVHPVKETPCLPTSLISALSVSNTPVVMSTNSTQEGIRDNPCQSVPYPTINAQLELFPSGDFIARSNQVERVYRRINPDDWGDDGIPRVGLSPVRSGERGEEVETAPPSVVRRRSSYREKCGLDVI